MKGWFCMAVFRASDCTTCNIKINAPHDDSAVFDYQMQRVQITDEIGGMAEFDPARCNDIAMHGAEYDDIAGVDVCMNHCVGADGESAVFQINDSLKVTVKEQVLRAGDLTTQYYLFANVAIYAFSWLHNAGSWKNILLNKS